MKIAKRFKRFLGLEEEHVRIFGSENEDFDVDALKEYKRKPTPEMLIETYERSIAWYEKTYGPDVLRPVKALTLALVNDADAFASTEDLHKDLVTATCIVFIKHGLDYWEMLKVFNSNNENISFDSFERLHVYAKKFLSGDDFRKSFYYVYTIWNEHFHMMLRNAREDSIRALADAQITGLERSYWIKILSDSIERHAKDGTLSFDIIAKYIPKYFPELANQAFMSALKVSISWRYYKLSDIMREMEIYPHELLKEKFDLTEIWKDILDTAICSFDGKELTKVSRYLTDEFGINESEVEDYIRDSAAQFIKDENISTSWALKRILQNKIVEEVYNANREEEEEEKKEETEE